MSSSAPGPEATISCCNRLRKGDTAHLSIPATHIRSFGGDIFPPTFFSYNRLSPCEYLGHLPSYCIRIRRVEYGVR